MYHLYVFLPHDQVLALSAFDGLPLPLLPEALGISFSNFLQAFPLHQVKALDVVLSFELRRYSGTHYQQLTTVFTGSLTLQIWFHTQRNSFLLLCYRIGFSQKKFIVFSRSLCIEYYRFERG